MVQMIKRWEKLASEETGELGWEREERIWVVTRVDGTIYTGDGRSCLILGGMRGEV